MSDESDAAAKTVEKVQADAADALGTDEVAAGIIEAGTLEQYVETLLALVDECRLHIGDHGFRVRAVDPGNVAMWAPATLSPQAFEHFESPGSAVVGIPLTTLADRLDPANAGDLVEWTLDMESRTLELTYRNIHQSVALIDPDSIRDEPDGPDLELPNEMVIEGEDFQAAVDVAEQLSDHFAIEARPDDREVAIWAEGDTDEMEMSFSDEDVIDADVADASLSMFGLDYIEQFAGVIPSDAEFQIRFGDEFPMLLSWAACDGHLSVDAMCAPRISTD